MSEELGTGSAGNSPLVAASSQAVGAGKLAEALAKAQGEFTTVPRTKTATIKTDRGSYTYTYADLADIFKMALPILAKHGLAFSQPLRRISGQLYLTSELLHVSGERMASDGLNLSETGADPRTFGIKLSYFRRYDASALLGVVTDDDLDAPDGVESTDKGVAGLRKPVVGLPEKSAVGGQQSAGTAKDATVAKPINERPISPSDGPAPNPSVEATEPPSGANQEPTKKDEPTAKEMAVEIAAILKKEGKHLKPNEILGKMIAKVNGKGRVDEVPKPDRDKSVRVFYHLLKEQGNEAVLNAARELTQV